jgi:hypothetical protein
VSGDTARQQSSKRYSLLEILRGTSQLAAGALFALAGFAKDSVDEFYEELRDLIRSGVVAEGRLLDGTSTLQLEGDRQ